MIKSDRNTLWYEYSNLKSHKYNGLSKTRWKSSSVKQSICWIIFQVFKAIKKLYQKYHQNFKQFGSRSGRHYVILIWVHLIAKIISWNNSHWKSLLSEVDLWFVFLHFWLLKLSWVSVDTSSRGSNCMILQLVQWTYNDMLFLMGIDSNHMIRWLISEW